LGLINRLRRLFTPGPGPSRTLASAPSALARSEKPQPIDGPKLNLGCGFDIRPGWVNIDLHDWHKPDIVADVTDLRVLPDNHAGYAVAQDILEHIHRARCLTALREWNRVLKPGGLLEIRVPDVVALALLMKDDPSRQTPEAQAVLLQCMFGTQTYAGDFHLNGFTEISLRHAFAQAGFEIAYLGHHDEWLFEAVGRKIEHTPPEAMLRFESDEDFLKEAYRLTLGREADEEGFAHFLDKLSTGAPRETVLETLRHARMANPEGAV